MRSRIVDLAASKAPLAVIIVAASACVARGEVNSGASDAYGLNVNLSALGGLGQINLGPLPLAQGTAPGPYAATNLVASVFASAPVVGSLSTGVIVVNANSNIDGAPGNRQAYAESTVDDLNAGLIAGLFGPVLSLSAATIQSTALVSSDGVNITHAGGFLIEDLTLNIAGVGNVLVDADAAPNTVVFSGLGISIIANEQILSGDGITSRGLTTNALRISVEPLGGLIVGGDLVIAHSHAELAVPTPSSAAAALGGVGLLGARRRRR